MLKVNPCGCYPRLQNVVTTPPRCTCDWLPKCESLPELTYERTPSPGRLLTVVFPLASPPPSDLNQCGSPDWAGSKESGNTGDRSDPREDVTGENDAKSLKFICPGSHSYLNKQVCSGVRITVFSPATWVKLSHPPPGRGWGHVLRKAGEAQGLQLCGSVTHPPWASGQGLEGLGRPVFWLLGAFIADSRLVVTKSPVLMPSFVLATEYF